MATEKRLIDANETINAFTNWLTSRYDGRLPRDIVAEIPTVDAVEVVRCKDCKHCAFFYPIKEIDKEPIPAWYCRPQKSSRKPDDYCSYGERK